MASPDPEAAPIAYILGTFPQASQTFIAREVRGLKQLGLPLTVFALARRAPDVLEPEDRQWYGDVRFVPRAAAPAVLAANAWWLFRDPARYLAALALVTDLPHRPRMLAWRAVILVMRAAWVARELTRAGGCRQIHAHFALAQTEVAMAIARLIDRPYTFTAHARDIYATPSALEDKIRSAAMVVTCTAYNVAHLRSLCPDVNGDRIALVHHGLDIGPARPDSPSRDLTSASSPPTLLAAGRLVTKKGFDTLIDACAVLRDRGLPFRCRIAGDGPLHGALARRIADAGLTGLVELTGWVTAAQLTSMMADAAVFVMPSQITESGDRDGIPNVILEAMGASLPVVATAVSGIPEAVADGVTGVLVQPGRAEALAVALERLLRDAPLRQSMGAAGRARAVEEFSLEVSSKRLADVFRRTTLSR